MEYTVIRSARKTIGLEIRPDLTLLVRVPYRASDTDIETTVQRHCRWIRKATERLQAQQQQHPPLTAEREQQLRKQAAQQIPPLVQQYADRLKLYPTAVRITAAKTRFGSCSAKNSLCFSFRLMEYPPEAVEYVVVHELCHIRHKHHRTAFYKLVQSVMPDYRQRQQLLKK